MLKDNTPKEYIEREKVRKAYIKSFNNNTHRIKGAGAIHIQEHQHMLHILDKMPAADVVEVVRCKDCQFGKYDDEQNMILCKRILNITDGEHFVYNKLDDFCSFGERKVK